MVEQFYRYDDPSGKTRDITVTHVDVDGNVTTENRQIKDTVSFSSEDPMISANVALGRPIYKVGNSYTANPFAVAPSVTLDKKTGDITVSAPDSVLGEDWFKEQFSENENLKKLSQAYKLNPDYAYETTDENGNTVYKKAEELVNEYDAGLKKAIEDLQTLYSERDRVLLPVYGTKVDKMSTEDIRTALTPTYNVGDIKVTNSTVISLPDFLLNHPIFGKQIKALGTFNAEEGTVQRGDFMDNFWNRNKNSELTAERIQELYQNLGTNLQYSSWDNVVEDDYERHGSNQAAREIAFRNFIQGQDPEADFLLTAGDAVTGIIGGVGIGLADWSVGMMNAFEWMGNTLTFWDGRDEHGVQQIAQEWDDWKAYNNEQLQLISDTSATWTNVAEMVTELVANIKTGNLVGEIAAAGFGLPVVAAMQKLNINQASGLGRTLAAFTIALESAPDAGKVIKSAVGAQKVFTAGGALTGSIVNITTQAIVDAALTDPVLFRRAIEGEGGEEAYNYLNEQFAWNVGGFAAGIGIGKVAMYGANTKVGRAINAKWAKGNAKLKTIGYNISDGLKAKIAHRSLEDVIAQQDEVAKAAKKTVKGEYDTQSMRTSEQLDTLKSETRAFARADIDVFDGLKISDEGLAEAEKYLTNIKALQNAIDMENRSLRLIVEGYDDIKINPEMAGLNSKMYDDVMEINKRQSEMVTSTGKVFTKMEGSVFSQEAANYIGATIEARYMEAVLANPAVFTDSTVKSAAKNIDSYKEAIATYTKQFSPELKEALDTYIADGKKWYASMNNYRTSNGLSNAQDLEDLLQNPMFDQGDYMRVQRKVDRRYKLTTLEDGTRHTNINIEFQHLEFSEMSDFMAPDTVQSLYKINTANAERNLSVLKTRLSVSSAMKTTLVSGEETQMIKTIKASKSGWNEAAKEQIGKITKDTTNFNARGLVSDYENMVTLAKKESSVASDISKTEKQIEKTATKTYRINDAERTVAANTIAPTDVKKMLTDSGKSQTGSILQDGIDQFADDADGFDEWLNGLPDESKKTLDRIRKDYNQYVGGMEQPVQYTDKHISFPDEQTAKGLNRKNLTTPDAKKTPMRSRRQLMKKELGTIDEESLTKSWFADADVKVKKDIATKISDNPKLHDAMLSEMYSLSGSDMPYDEWLETPMEIRRVQTSDALRNDDAFMSFSMSDKLPDKEGNVVTLYVKPKDTYGSVYLGSTSSEKEVLVPRDVYKKAWDSRVSQLESNVDDAKAKLAELQPRTNAKETISNLSYAERKALAQKFVQENPDYVVLYRVQNGTPDQFRPNNRGKKGKFEGNVGEYKGYVWMTSNPEWAEGPGRASAGVPSRGKNKVTDENIVVLPVKKSDITSYNITGSEAEAMRGLESGKKIVQSRGASKKDISLFEAGFVDRTNPRAFEKTEFILNGERNPEIFDDGMDIMLREYNKQFDPKSPAVRQALRMYQDDLDNAEAFLKDYTTEKTAGSPRLRGMTRENVETLIGVDPNLEDTINLQVLRNDKDLLRSEQITQMAEENKRANENFILNNTLKDQKAELTKVIGERHTDDFLNNIVDFSDRTIDNFITQMKRDPKASKYAKSIADATGDSEDDVVRYLALTALEKNQKEINKQIRSAFGTGNKEMTHIGTQVENAFNSLLENYVDSTMMYMSNSDLVSGELWERISDLSKKIENVSSEAADDFSNVIMTTDAMGRKMFMQVDPTVAKLYKTNIGHLQKPTTKWDEFNKLLSKTFRLGTTGVNLSSTLRQWFRDSGNAFSMGGAFKKIQDCSDELINDWGERIVQQLNDYDLGQLTKRAEETGEDIKKLAVERELRMGSLAAGQTTEVTLYKESLSRAKKLQKNIKSARKTVDDIMNGMRENYLRNRVYANNLLQAMNNGKTLEEARVLAEFAMNNATTNFSRKLVHLQRMADSAPYLSAAINGTKSFWRMATLDPVGVTTRIMAGFVVPQMYLTASSLADENNRRVYENLPEYTKSDSLVFVQNGIPITIPIPQELSVIVDPFRQFTESLYGANKNNFWELAANDILGSMPIDFSGFTAVDMDDLVSDPTIFDRIGRGASRVFSQVAPIPVKSAYMAATGIDPYSGKKLRDKSWVVWNDDTGEYETMDYNQGEFTKLVASWCGDNANATIVGKVLSGVFGNTGMDVADTIVAAFQRVGGDENADVFAGLKNQVSRIGGSMTGEDYSMLNAEWRRTIAQLEEERDAILASKEMQDIQSKLGQDIDEGTRAKMLAKRKDLLADWQKKVASTTTRLVEQGGTLDRYKFASVVQLLNMNSVNGWVPENKYLQNLTSQNYYAGQHEAYRTLKELGIEGASDYSIFGYIKYKDGQPQIVYNTPTSIITAENLLLSAKDVDKANIDALIKKADLYTQREQMYAQTDAIYNKKKLTNADYNAIDAIKMAYNNKVLATLIPYLEKVSPEAITNNEQVMDTLENLIQVPSAYEKVNNRFVSSGGGKLNKQQGFVRSYIKAILNKDTI